MMLYYRGYDRLSELSHFGHASISRVQKNIGDTHH